MQNFDTLCLTSRFTVPPFSWLLETSEINFYLSVKNMRDGIKITGDNIKSIGSDKFDPSLKTCFVVHGFVGDATDPWVVDLNQNLLQYTKMNIILVDWGSGKRSVNYTNAVRNTQVAATGIFEFLKSVKANIKQPADAKKTLWNNIYCIGHSLGAQICGKAGRLIQDDKFFIVERITGLDPARPCFVNEKLDLKLDKSDAQFVDIIHTQADNSITALGMRDLMGHADYYVNGGGMQPSCSGILYTARSAKAICSHFRACHYFTASIVAANSGNCRFQGYAWDRTYDQAVKIVDKVKNGTACPNCPEMGINAAKNKAQGSFLVLTSTTKPQCSWNEADIQSVLYALKQF